MTFAPLTGFACLPKLERKFVRVGSQDHKQTSPSRARYRTVSGSGDKQMHSIKFLTFVAAMAMFFVGCSFAQQPTGTDAGVMPADDSGMTVTDSGPMPPSDSGQSHDAGQTGPTPFRGCVRDEGGRAPYSFRVAVLDNEDGSLGTNSCSGGWDPYALCPDGEPCTNVGTPGEDLSQIVRDGWYAGVDVGFRCGTVRWQESLPADTSAEEMGVRVELFPTEGGAPIDVSNATRTVWNGRYSVLRVELCYQTL